MHLLRPNKLGPRERPRQTISGNRYPLGIPRTDATLGCWKSPSSSSSSSAGAAAQGTVVGEGARSIVGSDTYNVAQWGGEQGGQGGTASRRVGRGALAGGRWTAKRTRALAVQNRRCVSRLAGERRAQINVRGYYCYGPRVGRRYIVVGWR